MNKFSKQSGMKEFDKANLCRLYPSGIRMYILTFAMIFISNFLIAQDTLQGPVKLKGLSLEELMNVDVTSLSMRPEKLTEAASAVQVLTSEDIHRSAAIRLPEALQLVSNLQVARSNSHDWAITSRGFNGLPGAGGILANKLLVMIDGRSVYNPLFGGVYWDVQNILMKDVDRIEVVSGPGGTLWGANAVNGVINILTKSAKETQGLYATGASGSQLNDFGAVRVGSRSTLDSNLYFRIYAQHLDEKNTFLASGANARDAWNIAQGGFRADYYPSKLNTITVQGDVYGGAENKDSLLKYTTVDGQNVLARFTHVFSDSSDLKIQTYYDRTWRTTPDSKQPFAYSLRTYDLDIQHRIPVGKKQSILYGVGYRFQQDHFPQSLDPLSRKMPLYTLFAQDEIKIVSEKLKLTLGSKFLSNVYTGIEVQPCARLRWTPNQTHTVWTSVSRAVRTPSRFDYDVTVTEQKFKSEKVIAYELGYRLRPMEKLSFSFATFYNHYNDLRSLDSSKLDPKFPVIITNSQLAESWGFEFNGNYQATERWRLRGGYTYFDRNIWATSDAVLPLSKEFESIDPRNMFVLQSIMDLPMNLSFDLIGRYVDVLPAAVTTKTVPSYFTFDVRLAWQLSRFEISLAGQNLLEDTHLETGSSKIPRTIYARIKCQL